VAGVQQKIIVQEILRRIKNEKYDLWSEARGIPVEVKEARGVAAKKGKWNPDFGSGISNFVSVQWFQGECDFQVKLSYLLF
jgi:hypothetical protein